MTPYGVYPPSQIGPVQAPPARWFLQASFSSPWMNRKERTR